MEICQCACPGPDEHHGKLTSWHDLCSDGGLLIMGKAAQEKAKFRWYDTTRYEVSNKVSKAEMSQKARKLIPCNMPAAPSVLQPPCMRASTTCALGTESYSTRLKSCKQQLCASCAQPADADLEAHFLLGHACVPAKGIWPGLIQRLATSHVHARLKAALGVSFQHVRAPCRPFWGTRWRW